jgi:hypothetical protein
VSYEFLPKKAANTSIMYNHDQSNFLITRPISPKMVDPPLMLILRQVYPQYAIIRFGLVHLSHCFGSRSSIFLFFLLDHYIFL